MPKRKAYMFTPKKGENPLVIQFLDEQKNAADAIRYLIEKEIAENGIRNLSKILPAERDILPFNAEQSQDSDKSKSTLNNEISTNKQPKNVDVYSNSNDDAVVSNNSNDDNIQSTTSDDETGNYRKLSNLE